ncbi:hypothetical protein JIN77_05335 [Verrucomicrobiaceae bacterium R5-34]|uniref:DUF6036 domain-containing protein n=1 Tax=Oceaniferula flava TaxID=2800421 RepID=A0AAE2SC68_9BACT|nr:DUF6036 family nucleotidyltransferase [Oceaniferula flavus]MBK1830134.1 hypothetical protein [Verrucomicrobiaceae bacterium R5-34]MBK1854722.1 hypothetical protein [Oceaniferula flavus]MBM1136028.1 hypothetical protein [Oceaniferula flavus]
MNSDFKDLLQSLHDCEVRYLVAGGYAVMHHTQPRYTKDIDIWLEPSDKNARKLMRAFLAFGIPMIGVTESDFAQPKTQFSIGVPPCEIDFLTTISGLEFAPSWENKVISQENDFPIYYLCKADIITAKKTAGRPQDLADLDELSRADS